MSSVRFKESIQQTNNGQAPDFSRGGKHSRHELAHSIGEAVTKGEGAGGYLQVSI